MKKKVEVTINNQTFTFIGDDEAKIRKTAQFVDSKIKEVTKKFGIVNTFNALIMTMMVIADEHLEIIDKARDIEDKTMRLLEKVENFEVPCGARDRW